MPTILDYKCPACGGKVEFDSLNQKMKCPFCDTTFDVSELAEQDQILDQESQQDSAQDTPQEDSQEFQWEDPSQQWDE